jgi:hypothetical protein
MQLQSSRALIGEHPQVEINFSTKRLTYKDLKFHEIARTELIISLNAMQDVSLHEVQTDYS